MTKFKCEIMFCKMYCNFFWSKIKCGYYALLCGIYRTDKDKTRYTGALCGLGWESDSLEGDSAFPDHDMEIVFDCQFDITDLEMVFIYKLNIELSFGKLDCVEKIQCW